MARKFISVSAACVMKKKNQQTINNDDLGRILDIIKTSMKPEYKFTYDKFVDNVLFGNVLFLDYTKHGDEYSNYNYRWVWVKQQHQGKKEWFLVPFPQFHPNSLELLPYEMELAKRAYEDIKKHESDNT